MHASREQINELGRLRKRPDFLRVQRAGCKWVAKGLVLQTAEGLPGQKRFGVTVTKRLSKFAVVRNRARRRLRAVACDILPARANDGRDYILVARPETLTRPYHRLQADLTWCLDKLGYLQ